MIALPNECFSDIFIKLSDDNKSLFSCLLVNRQWCRNAVQILWSGPIPLKNRKFIKTCLSTLNDEEQAPLKSFGLVLSNNIKPLFEYTTYITTINILSVDGIIDWLNYEMPGPQHFIYSKNDAESMNVVQLIESSLGAI
ncbi:f-box domain-containing protein [Gigaspora margarita]|uniref:F-box domain-containing protein n=1 Tax=Gigaspora margarita TaxID=4874 RepID=A0A8H3XF67_GIGMA|nr:f-box domain-containing protein [Gigaspora margarita]